MSPPSRCGFRRKRVLAVYYYTLLPYKLRSGLSIICAHSTGMVDLETLFCGNALESRPPKEKLEKEGWLDEKRNFLMAIKFS